MNETYRPTAEEIGAYADGELDAEQSARVAYAAARDSAVAAQIAQIAKLKAVMPETVDDDGVDALASATLDAGPAASRPALRVGLAAAIALFLVGSSIYVATLALNRSEPPALYGAIVRMHEAWRETVDTAAPPPVPLPAAGASGIAAFPAPDLSSARLTLRTVEIVGREPTQAAHFGYTGTRGCRLSLFVVSGPLPAQKARPPSATLRFAEWSHGRFGFIAIASGMDPDHFANLAEALRGFTADLAPLGDKIEQRLAASRTRARPCLA